MNETITDYKQKFNQEVNTARTLMREGKFVDAFPHYYSAIDVGMTEGLGDDTVQSFVDAEILPSLQLFENRNKFEQGRNNAEKDVSTMEYCIRYFETEGISGYLQEDGITLTNLEKELQRRKNVHNEVVDMQVHYEQQFLERWEKRTTLLELTE